MRVEELRKESRLPKWANYVCYEDLKNLQGGFFILIGYTPPAGDPFFRDRQSALKFGYSRALTYQQYVESETGIIATYLPMSPESFEEEMPKVMQSRQISPGALELVNTEIIALHNAIAIAKSTRVIVAGDPTLESDFLKDPEAQALLDAPDGTNYRDYLLSHPGYVEGLLYRQKYYPAGIVEPEGGFKVYREGRLIFERDFGLDLFEPAGDLGKIGGTGKSAPRGLVLKMQMQDTESGLRFIYTLSDNGSAVGDPIGGKCDPITEP